MINERERFVKQNETIKVRVIGIYFADEYLDEKKKTCAQKKKEEKTKKYRFELVGCYINCGISRLYAVIECHQNVRLHTYTHMYVYICNRREYKSFYLKTDKSRTQMLFSSTLLLRNMPFTRDFDLQHENKKTTRAIYPH